MIPQHLRHIFQIPAVSAVLANERIYDFALQWCLCMHARGSSLLLFSVVLSSPRPCLCLCAVRGNLDHGNICGTITASQYEEAMASVTFRPTERRAFMDKRNRVRGFSLR